MPAKLLVKEKEPTRRRDRFESRAPQLPMVRGKAKWVSGAFAEDVYLYDMSAGGVYSVSTATFMLRYHLKEALKVAKENGDRTILFKNNPEIQEAMLTLVNRYGFTRRQLDHQCQLALDEYAIEHATPLPPDYVVDGQDL